MNDTQVATYEYILHKFNQWASDMGYYTDADIMRAQNDIADDVILQNTPVDIPAPQFSSYLDKINYIVACGYGIYGR